SRPPLPEPPGETADRIPDVRHEIARYCSRQNAPAFASIIAETPRSGETIFTRNKDLLLNAVLYIIACNPHGPLCVGSISFVTNSINAFTYLYFVLRRQNYVYSWRESP